MNNTEKANGKLRRVILYSILLQFPSPVNYNCVNQFVVNPDDLKMILECAKLSQLMRELETSPESYRAKLNAIVEKVKKDNLPVAERTPEQILNALANDDRASAARSVGEPGASDFMFDSEQIGTWLNRANRLENGDTQEGVRVLEQRVHSSAVILSFSVNSGHLLENARIQIAQSLRDLGVLQPEHPEQPESPKPHPTS